MNCFEAVWNLIKKKETFIIGENSYRLISRLGEGGFAVVDLMEDVVTSYQYALKRILLQNKETTSVCCHKNTLVLNFYRLASSNYQC